MNSRGQGTVGRKVVISWTSRIRRICRHKRSENGKNNVFRAYFFNNRVFESISKLYKGIGIEDSVSNRAAVVQELEHWTSKSTN